MGADLYIEPGYSENRATWEPIFENLCKFRDKNPKLPKDAQAAIQRTIEWVYDQMNADEFYFRDSYNSSSLLWTLGLSWEDVSAKCDDVDQDDGMTPNMSMTLCKWLMDEVSTRPFIKLPQPAPGETEADVLDYFTKKRAHLIAFLKRGIENGGVCASL